MKKLFGSIAAIVVLGGVAMAGGDIAPVEPVDNMAILTKAEGNFYTGLGISAVSARDASVSMDIFSGKRGQDRLWDVLLQVGYNINSYIAVEGRYLTTVAKENSVDMDSWGFYLKPQYPVTGEVSVYALIGYGGVKMDGVNGGIVNVDDNGFQWGLGVDYHVTETVSVFFDYTSLANDMDGQYGATAQKADADAFTLGITYGF